MKYSDAVVIAICKGWDCGIKRDSISGNGFYICLYGVKLILSYFVQLLLRVVFAVLFPLTACLVVYIDKGLK